jgi:hypothetical protein
MTALWCWPDLAATARHIEVVQDRIARLAEVRHESWEQLAVTIGRMYRTGVIGIGDLLAIFDEVKELHGPGFTKVWDEHVSIPSKRIRHAVAMEIRHAPNGPHGSWHGAFPIERDDRIPGPGTPVAYVIFDGQWVPAYTGSTAAFWTRFNAHRRQKPDALAWWIAYGCEDREAAFALEEELLAEHRPYLNKKVTR